MTERQADPRCLLKGCADPLLHRRGPVLLDLDGVVYLQGEPLAAAPPALRALRAVGGVPYFVTNNASRSADVIAASLTARGIDAAPEEVCTSAQAAARLLLRRCRPGQSVLTVGTDALAAEVSAVGLSPVRRDEDAEAVVQGISPETTWADLAEAAKAVRRGALWVATNRDSTLPSAHGPLPGNGTLVAAVAAAVGRGPDVTAGKPEPELLYEAVRRAGGGEPLTVGDRWDTDVAAARAAGGEAMLVLSGVVDARETLRIPGRARPDYLAWDLGGLEAAHPSSRLLGRHGVRCEGWEARCSGGDLRLSGAGDPLDALRALAQAAWNAADSGVPALSVSAADDTAERALRRLELSPGVADFTPRE